MLALFWDRCSGGLELGTKMALEQSESFPESGSFQSASAVLPGPLVDRFLLLSIGILDRWHVGASLKGEHEEKESVNPNILETGLGSDRVEHFSVDTVDVQGREGVQVEGTGVLFQHGDRRKCLGEANRSRKGAATAGARLAPPGETQPEQEAIILEGGEDHQVKGGGPGHSQRSVAFLSVFLLFSSMLISPPFFFLDPIFIPDV